MLGYGGTDKPTNAEAYAFSLVAQDVIDLLDALHGEERVIVIGHDWGSRIVGFLANLHTHRFVGFAFLAVGYNAPNPTISYPQLLAYTAQLTGQERFGYWSFFSEDGTDQIIKDRLDSFFSYLISLRFEDAPNFTPTGAYKATLLKNEVSPLPSFITQEEYDTQKVTFAKSGIIAPLCWYRVATSSIGREDSKKVPLDKYTVATPVFLAVAKEDPVAVPGMVIASTLKFCTNTTVREYDAGHWVLWEAKDQVNADLEQWIASL
ncbi:Bifunctional epoxide hydrolase 2 [Psilocybe cubensis]|uniref:Bifunctional epoxide hydrolase 2 n=2 Tax=Psilocybe cubensis TaxID=181762 RepID=A0ACB8HG31_PSICU|nr:Bifunctional epoxide hydrolase 2 [Psilocybe cubensis]KAH9486622.1 Bifunctional epoxide hydrolase 2 [Psilocybe cubensis]